MKRGVPLLSIPKEKLDDVIQKIEETCGYYHIPTVDLITQVNAITRGWCNYYRYANAPQKVFSKLMAKTWWAVAHHKARKLKTSIRQMLIREKKANRYATLERKGRKRQTFLQKVGGKTVILDLFPPPTGDIWNKATKEREVDLKPVTFQAWVTGHSHQSRLEAKELANGVCEQCGINPAEHVHHTNPLRGKSFLARIHSDRDQKKIALCKECHLKAHGGSYAPVPRQKGQKSRNAG